MCRCPVIFFPPRTFFSNKSFATGSVYGKLAVVLPELQGVWDLMSSFFPDRIWRQQAQASRGLLL